MTTARVRRFAFGKGNALADDVVSCAISVRLACVKWRRGLEPNGRRLC